MLNAHIFIRDDDIWSMDHSFHFFFDQMIRRKLPVIYAVIPGKMEKELIRFMCQAKEKHPHLLDIVQHGWMHLNHSTDSIKKYEFGASRTLESQREDIQKGLKQMHLAFGDYFTPAFVPPFHGYDENTLKVLREENFQIFSAGNGCIKKQLDFFEVSTNVSFSNYQQENISTYRAVEVFKMLIRDISRGTLSGILTHHEDFKTDVSRKELIRFFDLIESLLNREELKALLFSDLSNI